MYKITLTLIKQVISVLDKVSTETNNKDTIEKIEKVKKSLFDLIGQYE
jgi:hypothetical protein